MKSRLLIFALTASNALAIDYTWDGLNGSTPSSDWATGANWTGGVAPTLGGTFSGDRLVIANGATGSGAIYNPGAGVTTTFGSGRAFLVGSTGAGSLTITSGTIRTTGGANNPLMANGNNATLLINGGTLDVTGNTLPFMQVFNGSAGVTSTLTVSSGSFLGNGFDLYNSTTTLANGTLHLNGGTFAVTSFSRSATTGTGTSTINLNGGTLQARAASTSFLNNLYNTTVSVLSGGARINTNGFNITIAAPLIGSAGDGGLQKNTGGGILTLSGNNSYTGATAINAGGILISHANALGTTTGGTTVADGAWLALSGGITAAAETVTIAGDGTGFRGALQSASGANTWTGGVQFSGTGNNRIGAQDGASLTVSGNITETSAGSRIIFRPGTTAGSDITLTGTGNSWTGTTEIWSGSGALKLGLNNALPTASLLSIGNGASVGGTLDMNGFNQTSPGVSQFGGTLGRITNNGATDSTLTLSSLAANQSFNGIITDGATNKVALTLNSSGRTQTLTGANTYTGATTVTVGTLVVNGSLGNTSTTIGSGGTLMGTGTIGGTVGVSGTLAPGNSIGTLNFSQTLTLAGISDFEIDPTLGLGFNSDLANVTGAITYGGTLNVLYGGPNTNFTNGMVFNLFDGASFSGSFSTINLPDLTGTGLIWQNNLLTNGTITVVPEPTAALLGGMGLLALLRRRRD